ncbi:MAG: hypothetical protein K9L28_06030, partial [Synergistales bacterium]|nr:hypothetical protein [Synergistales bacterium]
MGTGSQEIISRRAFSVTRQGEELYLTVGGQVSATRIIEELTREIPGVTPDIQSVIYAINTGTPTPVGSLAPGVGGAGL